MFEFSKMPRKSIGNKVREREAQRLADKKASKDRQRLRFEKEFFFTHNARGLKVRSLGFQEAHSDTMTEMAIVYHVKEGHEDPFEDANVLYYSNPNNDKVVKREKTTMKEMREIMSNEKRVNNII